jgi:hypothetical protein
VPVVHGSGPSDRRSMQVAMVAVLAGVMLAATGAGQAWARVSAAVELPGIGSARLGGAELTGNDLAPLGALALLGLVLLVAVAATRGRGRWVVGLALLALGVALVLGGVLGGQQVADEAVQRARSGVLEGIPAGTGLRVATPRAGPALVAAGPRRPPVRTSRPGKATDQDLHLARTWRAAPPEPARAMLASARRRKGAG